MQDIEAELTLSAFTELAKDNIHAHFFIDTGGDGAEFPKWTDPATHPHRHLIVGKVASVLHLGLKEGEMALLLRMKGGQMYVVLCRLQIAANDYIGEIFVRTSTKKICLCQQFVRLYNFCQRRSAVDLKGIVSRDKTRTPSLRSQKLTSAQSDMRFVWNHIRNFAH